MRLSWQWLAQKWDLQNQTVRYGDPGVTVGHPGWLLLSNHVLHIAWLGCIIICEVDPQLVFWGISDIASTLLVFGGFASFGLGRSGIIHSSWDDKSMTLHQACSPPARWGSLDSRFQQRCNSFFLILHLLRLRLLLLPARRDCEHERILRMQLATPAPEPYRRLRMQWVGLVSPAPDAVGHGWTQTLSPAPDAVGHAWTRTHAGENARQNAR